MQKQKICLQKLKIQKFYILLMYWNIIDGNVHLHVPSHIPDNIQGVTEIVFDYLQKPSRVNIVTKENLIKFFRRSKLLLI